MKTINVFYRHMCAPPAQVEELRVNSAETKVFVLGCPGVCNLNSPMQISFLQLYNIETFYLELLFLSGKTVYCRVFYLWEGV